MCLGPSNWVSAQEVEDPPQVMVDNTWYLTKIVLEDQEMLFEPNDEVDVATLKVILLSEGSYNLEIFYCDAGEGKINFLDEQAFELLNYAVLPGMHCIGPDNLPLSNAFVLDFWFNEEVVSYEFVINQQGNNKNLIIIDNNENEAHFQNVPNMSVNNQQKSKLTISLNPVKDYLYIENLTEKVELEIYNLSGSKLISQELMDSSESIKVSQLSRGIYIYRLNQNGKPTKTGKLIKN